MVFFNKETKTLHGEELPLVHHPNASLGEILVYFLRKTPEKITQVSYDDGIEVSCGEMADMTVNCAKNLVKLGFKAGDVVGLIGKNVTYSTPTIFGCYLLACPISPLDPLLSSAEIVSVFKRTVPKIIFCDSNVVETIREVVDLLGYSVEIVTLTDRVDGFKHILEFFVDPGEEYKVPRNAIKASETVATFMRTTGTTEEPKLAKVSHAQLLHPLTINGAGENIFGFSFSLYSWVTCTFLTVSAVVNQEKRLITSAPFGADIFFDSLEKYKFTHFITAPGHYRFLLESPRYVSADLSSVKRLAVGGWHVPEELRRIMKKKITNGSVVVGGGMTEIGGLLYQTDPDEIMSSAIGKPLPNTQVKILLDDGSFGGFNDIGEVLVKRPDRFLGYLGNDVETAAAIDANGFQHTGDVGFIDKTLNVTLIGRKAFIIRYKDHLFQPSELEDIIQNIPGVKDVCVVGVPNEKTKELPTAMVLKDDASGVTEAMIHESVKYLEDYKQLRGGIFFVDEIALTISGKVKRNVMKIIASELHIKSQGNLK